MTRVIKIGGRPQSDPALGGLLAQTWAEAPASLVLVHGGGDEVSTLQEALGSDARFVNGRRVTTEQDIELVRMALSGSANKRLVSALVGLGIDAVGLSGEDAALIDASPMDREQLGYVGMPHRVNIVFLKYLLAGGYLPVISPVSRNGIDGHGAALNVNGDDAAAAIAVGLGAVELLLIADVQGVLCDGRMIPTLTRDQACGLLESGTAAGGMRAKVQAAIAALDGGVKRVRISDIAAIADPGRGTALIASGAIS
jgi:acetylglutamate kinase